MIYVYLIFAGWQWVATVNIIPRNSQLTSSWVNWANKCVNSKGWLGSVYICTVLGMLEHIWAGMTPRRPLPSIVVNVKNSVSGCFLWFRLILRFLRTARPYLLQLPEATRVEWARRGCWMMTSEVTESAVSFILGLRTWIEHITENTHSAGHFISRVQLRELYQYQLISTTSWHYFSPRRTKSRHHFQPNGTHQTQPSRGWRNARAQEAEEPRVRATRSWPLQVKVSNLLPFYFCYDFFVWCVFGTSYDAWQCQVQSELQ